ncbi:uncharacterized protein LOC112573619 [Pomacea canaliculata]|uniref:uncharacterized protein LOC112573619 n=1 Tax=Pomacea canaliculata TaxID=400727 RepID=UPI000D735952|nr:uncharacterized protein LOC112573619 [Pomacea canaliculata]
MSEVQGLRAKGCVFICSVNSQVQDNYLPHHPRLLLKHRHHRHRHHHRHHRHYRRGPGTSLATLQLSRKTLWVTSSVFPWPRLSRDPEFNAVRFVGHVIRRNRLLDESSDD